MENKNWFKTNLELIKHSFTKFQINFINALLTDFLGYLLFFAALALFYALFGYITEGTTIILESDTIYVLLLLLISLLTVALIALSSAIFKRWSYKITNKNFNNVHKTTNNKEKYSNKETATNKQINILTISFKQYYLQFFMWTLIWFILFVIASFTMKEEIIPVIMVILCIIYIYFTSILRTVMQTSFRKTMVETFSKALRIYKYIIHFIFMGIIIWIIISLTGFIYDRSVPVYATIMILLALLFITWARHYFGLVLRNDKFN